MVQIHLRTYLVHFTSLVELNAFGIRSARLMDVTWRPSSATHLVLPRGGLVRVVIQLGDFTTRSGIKGSQLEGIAFRSNSVAR